jgi:hypothetical protein
METSSNWPRIIAHLMASRSEVYDLDQGRFWGYSLPRVGASVDRIDAAERRLGQALDRQHREFLSYADGWPYVFQGAHILGSGELGQGHLWDEGLAIFRLLAGTPELPEAGNLRRWLPVAVDEEAQGVFVQRRLTGDNPVVWFSGGALAEQWPDFRSFLLGLRELNELDADALRTDPSLKEALARLGPPAHPAD